MGIKVERISPAIAAIFEMQQPVNSSSSKSSNIEQMVHKITSSGRISRADQQQFMAALLSKKTIGSTEEVLINRVFELLRAGRLRVVD